ncbi:beta-ketoacyl-[acyl-carrier-protein] synthase family protein [Crocinitomix catalasitica]|uniref:beta-ketoacyl-[acyl-carrier-protein] synthase family protein n=1 Tax=Crocinitomix catalasitica TaxID=184607 RepID=UPI0004898315|nr:beta-ketoacyl-[acyl-carrier-protein] synthase family protein [Crocinitomix catalasitica]
MNRVFVTGLGIISAIGNNLLENHDSLVNSESGLCRSKYLNSNYKNSFYFGEVKLSNESLFKLTNKQDSPGLTRTDLLAFKAVEEAIEDAKLTPEDISNYKTAFVSASTVGGMTQTDELYQDSKGSDTIASQFIESYSGHAHLLHLSKALKIKGLTDCINTACSSSANAIMIGAKWIKSGRADRVIVGGTDGLAKFTVNGFNSLQILSDEKCQPFDANRKGLNLGEGAAYLVLEREDLAKDKKKYAEISGYGNSNDAFHPSSLSADAIGVIKAMQEALTSANIEANNISYINAHGTATPNNDSTEILGITKIFGDTIPYSSTKPYTGHTLGAAGAIEAIFSILSIQHKEIYGNLFFNHKIEGFHPPILKYQPNTKVDHVLTNSFGFAGNCTSLLISKID